MKEELAGRNFIKIRRGFGFFASFVKPRTVRRRGSLETARRKGDSPAVRESRREKQSESGQVRGPGGDEGENVQTALHST